MSIVQDKHVTFSKNLGKIHIKQAYVIPWDSVHYELAKRPKLAKLGEVMQSASNHQGKDALSSSSKSFKHLNQWPWSQTKVEFKFSGMESEEKENLLIIQNKLKCKTEEFSRNMSYFKIRC